MGSGLNMSTPLVSLRHRDDLGLVLNEMGLIGAGVEVGVLYGENAEKILEKWTGQFLYLVDPYVTQDWSRYTDQTNTINFSEALERARQKLSKFDGRSAFVRKMSVDAAKDFKDDELDFVYIDGNHDYAAVLDDMDAWWPKVKQGGVLGGHDFYDTNTDYFRCGVESAVRRWTSEHKVPLIGPLDCTSWFVIKTVLHG